VKVSDERAIHAFTQGLRRADFVEEMGWIKPKTVAELMDVANIFADREDTYQNKRTRSPKDDRPNRYSNQRQRSRNYDNYGSHSQVAAWYKESNYQSDDRRNRGYRNDNRDDSGSNRIRHNEVKRALFQMFPTKAPGPNGFLAHFFQRHWHVCDDDITKVVLSIAQGTEST
jgi:hypothetical protein